MTRIVVGLIAMVVIMITIPILLTVSLSRRTLRLPRVGGAAVLRMPRGHWALMALIAFLPFAAISGLALSVEWAPGGEANRWILGGVMGLAGLLFGGYLLATELRGAIRLDDQTIERVGPLGRRRLVWSEVAKITFNPVNHWFFLTGPDGRTVYFAEGLNGIADFAELALARLPPAVLEASPLAVEALNELTASQEPVKPPRA